MLTLGAGILVCTGHSTYSQDDWIKWATEDPASPLLSQNVKNMNTEEKNQQPVVARCWNRCCFLIFGRLWKTIHRSLSVMLQLAGILTLHTSDATKYTEVSGCANGFNAIHSLVFKILKMFSLIGISWKKMKKHTLVRCNWEMGISKNSGTHT